MSFGVGSISVSLACSLESTNVFPRDKNKRRVMTIFFTLHPKWNFMGQREETSVAQRDFLCWIPNTFYKQQKCERFSKQKVTGIFYNRKALTTGCCYQLPLQWIRENLGEGLPQYVFLHFKELLIWGIVTGIFRVWVRDHDVHLVAALNAGKGNKKRIRSRKGDDHCTWTAWWQHVQAC